MMGIKPRTFGVGTTQPIEPTLLYFYLLWAYCNSFAPHSMGMYF